MNIAPFPSSDVWFAIPVAEEDIARAGATFAAWRRMGYKTAAFVESGKAPSHCTYAMVCQTYRGWAAAVNSLCRSLHFADWIVTGGADIYPDPVHRAEHIAYRCVSALGGTFGVVQPTGDRYGALDVSGPDDPIRAAVSPWIGKEFRERAYGGKGPLCEEYPHCYGDTELLHVARLLGCFVELPEVTQYHDHYLRRGEGTPKHLEKWAAVDSDARERFGQRKREGFPGHEPTEKQKVEVT